MQLIISAVDFGGIALQKHNNVHSLKATVHVADFLILHNGIPHSGKFFFKYEGPSYP